MSQDAAYEMALALAEESRHHGQCAVCGQEGEYGSDMYECPTCGVPVHEGACEQQHTYEHDEEES